MSAGVRLERVSRVLDIMGQHSPAGQPDILGRSPSPAAAPLVAYRANIAAIRNRAVAQAALIAVPVVMNINQRDAYEGAIAHLGSIVDAGANIAVGREKYLFALLSRTNFGQLPGYIRNHADLKRDVMIASGIANAGNWHVVINQPLFNASPGINQRTIDAWLNGIIAGADPFHWGQIPNDPRWVPDPAIGPAGHQSVGHVFEFRGVSPGGRPVNAWRPWALDLFDYVMNTINT
jgi:hypothetical protein